MSLTEKMSIWNQASGAETPVAQNDNMFEGVVNDLKEDHSLARLPLFISLILSSSAYEWLITNLQRECSFQWSTCEPRTMVEDIRQKILGMLSYGGISKPKATRWHTVTFRTLLAPMKLFLSQLSDESKIKHNLTEVLTTTGGPKHALVATVKEYIELVWPSSGLKIPELLQEVMQGREGSMYTSKRIWKTLKL
jgi:hypothetical protein